MNFGSSMSVPKTREAWKAALEEHYRDPQPYHPVELGSTSFISGHGRQSTAPQGEDSSLADGIHSETPRAVTVADSDEESSIDLEIERARKHYSEHGWLRAPSPSKRSRASRRSVTQLLGLAGDCEDPSSEATCKALAETIVLVKEIFEAKVSIVVFRENDALFVSSGGIDLRSLESLVEAHLPRMPHSESCVVAEHLNHDWRFIDNPRRREGNIEMITAASLNSHLDGCRGSVGYICIYNRAVDLAGQQILNQISDMLMSRLEALTSLHLEQHNTMMYEACISFLRRGIARAKSPNRIFDGPDSRRASIASTIAEPTPDGMSIKRGPREQLSNRVQDIGAEHDLLQDYCSTLRGMLQADLVTIIGLEDFNIHAKRNGNVVDLVSIISAFNLGIPLPEDVEPVVLTSHTIDSLPLVAYSCPVGAQLQLDPPARSVMACFLQKHLQNREFWWKREPRDGSATSIMDLLPASCQIAMSIVYFTPDATPKFVTFAAWNRSFPSEQNCLSHLHFAWVLHGSLRSALAVRRNRWLESSHLTYANTQAHNLKTPLHHILAVTQILRSSISELAEQQNEQIRDLLPFMDAIDTSGNHLRSIIDNILSFLELKGMERIALSGEKSTFAAAQGDAEQPLGALLNEIVATTCEAETRARKARGEPPGRFETVLDIQTEELASNVTEDARGLLRAVLAKLLANAYKACNEQGSVEVSVAWDIPPQSEDKLVRLTITDDGPGMSHHFIQNTLGEPWAKEDPNATGSGLSVYLAYRMVDLLGGHMNIQSAPARGCTVTVVVPLPRRESSQDEQDKENLARTASVVGFDGALHRVLHVELTRLGVQVVQPSLAQVAIVDGRLEETEAGMNILSECRSIVYLVFPDHQPLGAITDQHFRTGVSVRRILKPVTSRTLREALRLDLLMESRPALNPTVSSRKPSASSVPTIRVTEWRKEDVGDLIAGLALGQMPDMTRSPSSWSTEHVPSRSESRSSNPTPQPETISPVAAMPIIDATPRTDANEAMKILVVEDNAINRKILVKILKSRKSERPATVFEAEDGLQAVEAFQGFSGPSIVLLDINMPKLDGFGACTRMRAIESEDESRGRSQIIAITAMSGEADRQKGLGECGMSAWLCKPISKPAVVKVVEEAARKILNPSV